MQPDKMTPENNVQPVPPVEPADYKIIRKIEKNGTITYRHPNGSAVKTNTFDLGSLLSVILGRIDTLVWLMDGIEDVDGRVGGLLESLNDNAKQQVHEIVEFIKDTIGWIEVDVVSRDDGFYRPGRVVGLNLEPSEKWEDAQSELAGKPYAKGGE